MPTMGENHEIEEVSIENLQEREKWLQSLVEPNSNESTQSQTRKPQLQRVPKMLREIKDFDKYFVPKVVSIGPYHHANPNLQPMEDAKKELARKFILTCGLPVEDLYNNLFNEIKEVREFYEEDPTYQYNDEAFTQMMLVDGCFVLYYIFCFVSWNPKNLNMKSHYFYAVLEDLILLENQLPFFVLELLFGKKFQGSEGNEMIETFIDYYNVTPQNHDQQQQHRLLPTLKPSHLLQMLRIRLIGASNDKKIELDLQENDWPACRSVTELMAVGIHFKPSPTNSLTDIQFNPHYFSGDLKLPPINIDEITKLKFMNLIAYEMCADIPGSEVIQSYICFLQSLVSRPDDVKELREAGILNNVMGSDEEVVKIFKELAANSVPDINLYMFIQSQIGGYLKHRGKTKVASWLVEVLRDYFQSPWTTLALVAGTVALASGILQTIYTILAYINT